MKKMLNLVATFILVFSAATSVVACSNGSDISMSATVDNNNASKINVSISKGNWDATLLQGIKYQGYQLDSSLYSVQWINNKLSIFLNFKVMKDASVAIIYDNKSYKVNDQSVTTTLSENDKQVVKNINQLQTKGITFASIISANEVLPTGGNNLISLTNYIKENYFTNIANQSDYVIKSFTSDSNFFKPIKLNTSAQGTESYIAGSYEFIVYNTKEKQYVGSFPYKISLNIASTTTSDFNNFVSSVKNFDNNFGNFNLKTFFNILQNFGINTNSGFYPMIKALTIFGATIDDIMNNSTIKAFINNLVGHWGYFDLSKILDTSQPLKTINGTNYYNITSQYQNLVNSLASDLSININNTFTKKINLTSVGSFKISNSNVLLTINLRPMIYSMLPDILHFLNFIHQQYSQGDHNLILMLLQYLTDLVPNSSSSSQTIDTIQETSSYSTDNFCLINQYYDNNKLQPISISKSYSSSKPINNYINDNLENLIYDAFSFKNSNNFYVSWNMAVKGATKGHNDYVYLYNENNNVQTNAPAVLLAGSLTIDGFSGSLDSSNFKDSYSDAIVEIYSLRTYFFNDVFPTILSRQALTDPASSVLLTPIVSLIQNNISLSQDNVWNFIINTHFSINYKLLFANETLNIPLNISKNITISKQEIDSIVFNCFKNSLLQANKGNKLFSDDLINSITSFKNMTGTAVLQYKDQNNNWVNMNANNIANLFNWDTTNPKKTDQTVFVNDFRIEFNKVSFQTSSTLGIINNITVTNQNITLSPDFDLPFF